MKTNLEWLSEMQEPERSQAIENCKNDQPYSGDNISSKLCIAIARSFLWITTPEGEIYWSNIYKKYYTNGTGS